MVTKKNGMGSNMDNAVPPMPASDEEVFKFVSAYTPSHEIAVLTLFFGTAVPVADLY